MPVADPLAGPPTPQLAFDLPSTAALRASPRKVFAHYWTPLPISLDDEPPAEDYYARNYLTPGGEKGKHEAYGGLLRDRPLPRDPLPGDWRLQDMRTEVRQAVSAGLDGFTLDVIQYEGGSDPQLWRNAQLMMKAAEAEDPGFAIMLMPDLGGSLAKLDESELAAGLVELARSPSAYHLPDGRLVVSPFKAEAHDAAWWSRFLHLVQTRYGIRVALLPTFVGDESAYRASFARVSYGMSIWGSRNPGYNDPRRTGSGSARGRAAAVQALGKVWMQPVSVQDERPAQGIFDEAANTQNLRDTWQLARRTDAQLVQIPTWNDYTEGTQTAPSVRHGWSYLDLTSYYLTWYKTGRAPQVRRDAVYLTHRTQAVDAPPTYPQSEVMKVRGGSAPRDTVEALTFLVAPGRVVVQVGNQTHSCPAGAGVAACTVPLAPGRVSVRVERSGAAVAEVASPWPVTDAPAVQDLQYVAVTSLRPAPAPPGAA